MFFEDFLVGCGGVCFGVGSCWLLVDVVESILVCYLNWGVD